MSQAEELLQSLSEHDHLVVDSDARYVVNPITRMIENDGEKVKIMQYDHNSEILTFEITRYIEGHDMALCNATKVHYLNIEANTEIEYCDSYEVEDLRVDPEDDSKVVFSWPISRYATQFVGPLWFAIQFACKDNNGDFIYEWHTDINQDNEVEKSINHGDVPIREYTDILEQWRQRLFGTGDSVLAKIDDAERTSIEAVMEASVTEQNAIATKGKETIKSIPEDYASTYNLAREGARTKANAISMETEGEAISVDDSEDAYVRNLRIFGKTTPKLYTGKNLFDYTALSGFNIGTGVIIELMRYQSTNNNGGYYLRLNGTSQTPQSRVLGTIEVLAGTTVTLSANNTVRAGNSPNNCIFLETTDSNPTRKATAPFGAADNASASVTLEAGIYAYGIAIAVGSTFSNFEIRPQLEIGSTATEFEQYTGGVTGPSPEVPVPLDHLSNPTVSIYGKNRIANDREAGTTEIYRGVAFTTNADKSITVSGAPTAAVAWNIVDNMRLPAGTYYLSGAPANTSTKFRLQVNYKPTVDGTEQTGAVDYAGTGAKMTLPYDAYVRAYIYVASDAGAVSGTFYPQLEFGSAATEYEPYKPVQTLIIDRDIPGIPVIIGGNYTDANGQRWICDEVDFKRGVYIQRVAQRVLDGATDYTQAGTQFEGTYTAFASYNDVWIDYRNCFMSKQFVCYPGANYSDSSFNEEGVYSNNSTNNCNLVIFRISNDRGVTDLNSFKAWIAKNPVTVLCPLKTPIETPLTAAELTAFEALRTHRTYTKVTNDKGAYMIVEYNGDIKCYIDKLPIEVGSLTNGVTMADRTTGKKYVVYIDNGKLTMAESEG